MYCFQVDDPACACVGVSLQGDGEPVVVIEIRPDAPILEFELKKCGAEGGARIQIVKPEIDSPGYCSVYVSGNIPECHFCIGVGAEEDGPVVGISIFPDKFLMGFDLTEIPGEP